MQSTKKKWPNALNQSTESKVKRWRRLSEAYYMYNYYCRKPVASIAYMYKYLAHAFTTGREFHIWIIM